MKTYTHKDAPLKLFGIPFFEQTGKLYRLPPEITDKIETLSFYGRRSAGSRLCFRTDASEFTVKVTLETLSVDIGLSIYACQSAHVLIGERNDFVFAGHVRPDNYDMKCFERTFTKSAEMEEITIFLPRNEIVECIEITVDDNAKVEPPTPYKDILPILYYGSSITEAGNCSTGFNAYNAIISSRLNVDYYNLGFSGSARGEIEVADYISTIDMSLFVYDYDHNAPTLEYLEATHEPFFKRIREKHPDLPVIMISHPEYNYSEASKQRRQVIINTYENALKNGDSNVYFIDGESFFSKEDHMLCFMDELHPNDIGMLKMANGIEPVITQILKSKGILK